MNFALVIPCYNEGERLLVDSYKKFIQENNHFHLYFVDDGSGDTTSNILKQLALTYSHKIHLITLEKNQGKAQAIRSGINLALEESSYDYLGYWDADLATPLSEIKYFEKLMLDQSPWVVLGSRILRIGGKIKRTWYRHILGRIFATVASLAIGFPIYDTQCGAKFFKKDIAQDIFKEKFIGNYLFDIELLLRLKIKFGRRLVLKNMIELPLTQWKDISGSKIKLQDFFKAPFELLKILIFYKSKN